MMLRKSILLLLVQIVLITGFSQTSRSSAIQQQSLLAGKMTKKDAISPLTSSKSTLNNFIKASSLSILALSLVLPTPYANAGNLPNTFPRIIEC